MSNLAEIREQRCESLFDLLELKKLNQGTQIKGIDSKIERCKAAMKVEDIKHVEERIANLQV